jgi:hypothetical protein
LEKEARRSWLKHPGNPPATHKGSIYGTFYMKIKALGEKSGMETQFKGLPGKRKTDSWINANCQR